VIVMRRLRAFGRFWYEFIVGDDWRVAVGVVMALGVTSLVAAADLPAWWVLPAAVLVVLPLSVWRAARTDRSATTTSRRSRYRASEQ
jgi:hypothetical protein